MKKTLAFFVAMCMIATFSTCVFATNNLNNPNDSGKGFDFDNLLNGEYDVNITQMYYNTLNGKLINGCWVAAKDNSSLTGILSTTSLNNIPVFILTNPTATTLIFPASSPNEKDKTIEVVYEHNESWITFTSTKFNQTIKQNNSSEIIGYTSDLFHGIGTAEDNKIFLFVDSKNQVYPIIITVTNLDSGTKPLWKDIFPKNNKELTKTLRKVFENKENYSYYISPIIDDSKDNIIDSGKLNDQQSFKTIDPNRRPHYTIFVDYTEGGSVLTPESSLFLAGGINQKYIVSANEGYTIHYIKKDDKIIPSSINCGDTATVTFDCIYGNRSIYAVFKPK